MASKKNKLCISLIAVIICFLFNSKAQAGELSPTLGDDGHYFYDWYHQSFFELSDDLEEAIASDKVLMVQLVQKGCIYCEKVATEILSEPLINSYVRKNFLVVQLDIFGSRDVTDFDGSILPENEMSEKWGVVFTPSIFFLPTLTDAKTLPEAAASMMPGAFMKGTFYGMLQWIKTGAYKKEPRFQKYFNDHFETIQKKMKLARSQT